MPLDPEHFPGLTVTQGQIDAVVSTLEAEAGISLSSTTDTVTVRGEWGELLHLPAGPTTAIESITHASSLSELAPSCYEVTAAGARLIGGPTFLGHPSVAAHGPGPNWGGTDERWTVEYTHGIDDPAPSVVELVRGILARSIVGTPGVRQEQTGPFSVTFAAGAGTVTVSPADRKRLRRYLGI